MNDIINLDFVNKNKNLTNFTKYSLNYSNPNTASAFGLDVDDIVKEMVYSEINQRVSNILLKNLLESDSFDYIDYINKNIDDNNFYRIVVELIKRENYKYLIVNCQIGSLIQDSPEFAVEYQTTGLRTSAVAYSIGKIRDTKIYVDPYMKFNDNKLFFFNNIDINLSDFRVSDDPSSFSNLKLVDFLLDFEITDSKIVYVLDSVNSEGYFSYKRALRDKKIDNILDNEKS